MAKRENLKDSQERQFGHFDSSNEGQGIIIRVHRGRLSEIQLGLKRLFKEREKKEFIEK